MIALRTLGFPGSGPYNKGWRLGAEGSSGRKDGVLRMVVAAERKGAVARSRVLGYPRRRLMGVVGAIAVGVAVGAEDEAIVVVVRGGDY